MPKRTYFVEVGQRIGRGVVIDADVMIRRSNGHPVRMARLVCDCGNEYVSALSALVGAASRTRHATRSCGCLRRERQVAAVSVHGMGGRITPHPLVQIWRSMIQRCESPNDISFPNYGGRGISVCDRWHDPRLFAGDILRDLGPRPKGWSIDRIDNDGNYEPGNVRWASAKMQAANRRPRDLETARAVSDAVWAAREYRTGTCEHCGADYQTRSITPQMFCSKKCKAAARRASGVDNVERTCHVCTGSFTCNRYDSTRHCSRSCGATCQHAGGCPPGS
jgi:hypothetical protein